MLGSNIMDKIICYEEGELSEDETIEMFQLMLDSGLCWQLQGHYGRTAQALLDSGLISHSNKGDEQ